MKNKMPLTIIALLTCVAIPALSFGQMKSLSPNKFQDLYKVVAPSGSKLVHYEVVKGPVYVVPKPGLTPSSFMINEDLQYPEGQGGEVIVQIGKDAAHYCSLDILDRDFDIPVMLSSDCHTWPGYKVAQFDAGFNDVDIKIAK